MPHGANEPFVKKKYFSVEKSLFCKGMVTPTLLAAPAMDVAELLISRRRILTRRNPIL
jgi:hypothetical protein